MAGLLFTDGTAILVVLGFISRPGTYEYRLSQKTRFGRAGSQKIVRNNRPMFCPVFGFVFWKADLTKDKIFVGTECHGLLLDVGIALENLNVWILREFVAAFTSADGKDLPPRLLLRKDIDESLSDGSGCSEYNSLHVQLLSVGIDRFFVLDSWSFFFVGDIAFQTVCSILRECLEKNDTHVVSLFHRTPVQEYP